MIPWQVQVAQARMAGPVFGQRAYRYRSLKNCVVRFYPSQIGRVNDSLWFDSAITEAECISEDYTRLTDAEAQAIWATRPEGMK